MASPAGVSAGTNNLPSPGAYTLVREPFAHFLLLGVALFAANHYFQEHARFTSITVTQDNVHAIAENYRLQYGNRPSPQQLNGLIDNFIRDEIFYREALKLGLDAGDEIVRRRLVQKYEFLQQDLALPLEPSDSDLRKWYYQHTAKYVRPATVTFRHVFFSTDLHGDTGAREAAQAYADDLNRHGRLRVTEAGDRFPGVAHFEGRTGDELAQIFGDEGLAKSIFTVAPHQWSAPLRFGCGKPRVRTRERATN